MPPLCFDAHTVEIVEVSDEQLAQHPLPDGILPLAQLLVAETFPYVAGDFPRIKLSAWGPERGRATGKRIVQDLLENDLAVPFSQEIIHRLNILGVFPDFNYIRKHFLTLGIFASEIGAEKSKQRKDRNAYFDTLTDDEMIEFILLQASNFSTTADGPDEDVIVTKSLIQDMASAGACPSLQYLWRRKLSVTKINDVRKRYSGMGSYFGIPVQTAKLQLTHDEQIAESPFQVRDITPGTSPEKDEAVEVAQVNMFEIDIYYWSLYPKEYMTSTVEERIRNYSLAILMNQYMREQKVPLPPRVARPTIDRIMKLMLQNQDGAKQVEIKMRAIELGVIEAE